MAFDWKFGPGIVSVHLWTDMECNRPPLGLVVGPYSIAQMFSDWQGIDIGSTLGCLRLDWLIYGKWSSVKIICRSQQFLRVCLKSPWGLTLIDEDWNLVRRLVNDCSQIGWFLDCFLDWPSLGGLLMDWQFFQDWQIGPGLVLDWHWIGRKMNWVIGHGLGDLRFEIELEYWSELDILAEWQNHAPSRHFGGSL